MSTVLDALRSLPQPDYTIDQSALHVGELRFRIPESRDGKPRVGNWFPRYLSFSRLSKCPSLLRNALGVELCPNDRSAPICPWHSPEYIPAALVARNDHFIGESMRLSLM